ncbi:MAG: DNA ligase D [Rhodospirillales bacterium]|nr:DNA ligase D [Rhodospirillales bacterium]
MAQRGSLEEYRRKRDFSKTPEPAGGVASRPGELSFVVQKHAARRLHYDFRLELDGVLKSWAVTKGPSYDPGEKRLAVQTEDHPIDYGGFEGVIPKSEYGGGTVLLWDRGRWFPEGDPEEGLRKGKLKFRLEGEKLHGGWALVRMRGGEGRNWLLVKERDEAAREGVDILDEAPQSVASGRDLDAIADAPERVWHSDGRRFDPSGLPGAVAGDLPDRIEPQLATLVKEAPEGDEWLHEIKFDGYRAMARLEGGRARLFTRHGLDWTDKFGALAGALAHIVADRALVDGEVVVLDAHGASHFQALQEALSEGRTQALVYFAFDLLHLDGWDLREVPLERRKEALAAILPADQPAVRYSDHFEGRGPEVRRKACSFALEGVVSKRRDRPYRAGRGADWTKAKCLNRQEFVIVGFTPPQGARRGIGALLLGYHRNGKLLYAGKVGTGFSERTLEELRGRLEPLGVERPAVDNPPREARVTWVEPTLVAEVEFANWTREGALRHPSFQGLRFDKEPAEIVREASFPGAATADRQAKLEAAHLTHPDRVLWPRQGVTKRGLAAYYIEVAEWMLPHVVERAITLVRCPQGRHEECFYQRHATAGMPDSIGRVAVAGEKQPYLFVRDLDGLLALVQVGVLEIHTWGSRVDKPEAPDRLVFDLDPAPDVAWPRVVEAAREVRARLEDLGLRSFVKTTGGKGLHVVVPIDRGPGWDEIKAFTKAVSEALEADSPRRYTANMSKAKRNGRIYVDFLRNQWTATFIAPFSTRAKPGAPVAVPLSWEELDAGLHSDHFNVETILRRLAGLGDDPWAEMAEVRQTITAAARRNLGLG